MSDCKVKNFLIFLEILIYGVHWFQYGWYEYRWRLRTEIWNRWSATGTYIVSNKKSDRLIADFVRNFTINQDFVTILGFINDLGIKIGWNLFQ